MNRTKPLQTQGCSGNPDACNAARSWFAYASLSAPMAQILRRHAHRECFPGVVAAGGRFGTFHLHMKLHSGILHLQGRYGNHTQQRGVLIVLSALRLGLRRGLGRLLRDWPTDTSSSVRRPTSVPVLLFSSDITLNINRLINSIKPPLAASGCGCTEPRYRWNE